MALQFVGRSRYWATIAVASIMVLGSAGLCADSGNGQAEARKPLLSSGTWVRFLKTLGNGNPDQAELQRRITCFSFRLAEQLEAAAAQGRRVLAAEQAFTAVLDDPNLFSSCDLIIEQANSGARFCTLEFSTRVESLIHTIKDCFDKQAGTCAEFSGGGQRALCERGVVCLCQGTTTEILVRVTCELWVCFGIVFPEACSRWTDLPGECH